MVSSTCSRGYNSLFSNLSLRHHHKSTSRHLGQIRKQSTARRTTKRLRATPTSRAPRPHLSAVTHSAHLDPTPANATRITFDPPSSAPTSFHTPSLFLPQSDPRRKLHASTVLARSNPYVADPNRTLPPTVYKQTREKKYHLTPADLKEMRELRAQDPQFWTRPRLAEKFGCSEMFVMIGAQAPREQSEAWWSKHQDMLNQAGPKKRKARSDKTKRKELWRADA